MRGKRRKNAVAVKPKIAEALGLSQEDAELRVKEIMQKKKVLLQYFLNLLIEDGKALICTSRGTIECDMQLNAFSARFCQPNVGFTPGGNSTGHELPASSNGW